MRYLVNASHGEVSVFDTEKSLLILSPVKADPKSGLYKSNEGHFYVARSDYQKPEALTAMEAFKLYFTELDGVINVKYAEKLFGIRIKGDI